MIIISINGFINNYLLKLFGCINGTFSIIIYPAVFYYLYHLTYVQRECENSYGKENFLKPSKADKKSAQKKFNET